MKLMLIFVGLLFMAVGGYAFSRERLFFKRALMVRGVVVDWTEKKHERLWTPIVQFEFDGQIRRVSGTFYSNRPPKKGSVMWVGINPRNTEDVRIKQKGADFLCIFTLLAGAATTLLGISVFLNP